MKSFSNKRSERLERFVARGGIVLTFLVAAFVLTAIIEPRFLNRLNLLNVMRNFSLLALPAIAQMLVMTTGGFDLSVGAIVAIGTILTAFIMAAIAQFLPGMDIHIIALTFLSVVACGAIIGAVNGFLVAFLMLSPFMVTLAVGAMLTGIALYFTQGIPVYGLLDTFTDGMGRSQFGPAPLIFYVVVAFASVFVVVQRTTSFGRHVYATGSDARSARLAGVNVKATTLSVYALSGTLAAITGFLMAARLGSGQANIGATLAMETIAAAVIGGVSLRGGVGRTELVIVASMFLTIIGNGLNLLKIDTKYQTLVLGLVLIIAISIERLLQRRTR
ncbi:ABC transporter permease [Rhizobium rhizogenes]|uniref:Autoinducer 2 import system permease protein LsrD n=1 Tax=Rhizobium rhizogenes TaxID=359 RepID=A0AA92H7H9_RHIRH|nr:ABC transporter permease [Rhizobium rhizogenes]PVE50603.1 ABC transporter permease [Rhizobium rhizogenes]PVE62396.1 ABC transporter permease [Agrobacterium tumefaciens]PVE70579.1 ABC transporter permease [Sphingomonas sp. TPD3009]